MAVTAKKLFLLEDILEFVFKSNDKLDADHRHYRDFITSFHVLNNNGHIKSLDNFIALLKSIFAFDPESSRQVEFLLTHKYEKLAQLFEEFIRPQAMMSSGSSPEENDSLASSSNNPIEENDELPETPISNTKKNEDQPIIQNKNIARDKRWDRIELMLGETDQGQEKLKNILDGLQKKNFPINLNDQAILTMSPRYFAQRGRHSFQSSDNFEEIDIDVYAMVNRYAEIKMFEEIIYTRSKTNKSNVVLFADRFGAMLAYEFLEEFLIDSFAQIPECRFEKYYFYNLPKALNKETTPDKVEYLFTPYGMARPLHSQAANWNEDTCFIIFSDGGAHSSTINGERIANTISFWEYLKNISERTYWINPVPLHQMKDCTARRLSYFIPMFDVIPQDLERLFSLAKNNVRYR